jgi:hypothetical protein
MTVETAELFTLSDARLYYMQDLGAARSDVVGDQHLFDQDAAIDKFAIPETGMP